MNILLLGSGGREHALACSLRASALCDELYVAPGNGGTCDIASNVALDGNDAAAVSAFAHEHQIGLVVIGPEAPLVAGVADAVRACGISVFGPGAAGAQLEGSKSFAKDFMGRHGLPTARWQVFDESKPAHDHVDRCFEEAASLVIKADGLAAGKGVIVAQSSQEAHEALQACFDGKFGSAGARVVIEECLSGPECSLLAFVSGSCVRLMAPAQDHKRAFEADRGPNTGGMGVYSPVPIVSCEERHSMEQTMQAAADGLVADGIDYRGVLYGGFMLTPQGPKLLEFNARFGDPETQVILPRLKNDLAEVMLACAQGNLADIELEWRDEWAVGVVLASAGYPGAYAKGFEICGLDEAAALDDVVIYHAGTVRDEAGVLRTAGGRVLNVCALGETFAEARDRAYEACECINFEGKFFRRDIGARALAGRSAWEA